MAENASTVVAVYPLGPNPRLVQPDEMYVRLSEILKKKRDQLPRASRGLILLDVTELDKLMVDQETIQRATYGDLVFRVRQKPDGGFERRQVSQTERVFHADITRLGSRGSKVKTFRCRP